MRCAAYGGKYKRQFKKPREVDTASGVCWTIRPTLHYLEMV